MNIYSEIGLLKTVLVHKPNITLKYITPDNAEYLLFDDVLWTDLTIKEHDYFTDVLKEHGVNVLVVGDLLQDILNKDNAKRWLLNNLTKKYYPSLFLEDIKNFLNQQNSYNFMSYITGGLTFEQLKCEKSKNNLISQVFKKNDFVLNPLPNHLFTRDTSCWIGNGVTLNSMCYPVRYNETINIAAIYKFHPFFKNKNFDIWYDIISDKFLPSLEGGDILVLNKRTLLIGFSERTTLLAIEILAKKLFLSTTFNKIIVLNLPKKRSCIHLDTLLTMVDVNCFCSAIPDKLHTWIIQPGNKKNIHVSYSLNPKKEISQSFEDKNIRFIEIQGDFFSRKQEQWNDAANVLAISPGNVIAYNRNINTNLALKKAGINVIEIPGSELIRGRGGPRCMSCPIEREEISL